MSGVVSFVIVSVVGIDVTNNVVVAATTVADVGV